MKVVGIDPGVTTGWALAVNGELEQITSGTLYEMVLLTREFGGGASVAIEDARKRKWYGSNAGTQALKGAGSIERDCKIWEEIAQYYDWEYYMVHPKKIETKLDHETFCQYTGWSGGRTNEHVRDASMLAVQFNPRIASP